MSGPNALPDIVIKLGLANQAKEDSIFRRITPQQLKRSKRGPIKTLKASGALLSLSLCDEPADFDIEGFDVSLTYTDRDGDKVLIHNRDDLIDAMEEWADLKKLKVFADVKAKPKPPSRAPVRASISAPAVDSATQTSSAKAENRRPKQPPVPVQDIVESLVGILANATTTAANAVHNHMNEKPAVRPSEANPGLHKNPSAPPPPQDTPTEVQSSTSQSHSADVLPDEVDENPSTTASRETSVHPVVQEENAPKATPPVANTPPKKTEETSKLFIHGRHTCDSCLTTPIVGKRFHAANAPDYDLCGACMENYTGKDVKFEEAELDRDRIFQVRWHRRHAKWGARGRCRGPNRRSDPANPQRGSRRGGRFPPHGPPCGPHGFPHGPPPHGPPPPHGFPHGPPPHGPPPPHGFPHGPPPHGFPHGPPPHGFPHGPHPFGPPPHGSPPFPPPHMPFGCPPPHHTGCPEGTDLALMEAIRRSMENVAEHSATTEESTAETASPEEPSALEKAILLSTKEAPETEQVEEEIIVETPAESKSQETSADSPSEDTEELEKAAPVTSGEVLSDSEEKSRATTPSQVSRSASVPDEVHLSVCEDFDAIANDTKSQDSPSNTSFALEAAGYGAVAEGLGETLDIIGSAIDDVNFELARTTNYAMEDNSDEEETEIVIDAVCTAVSKGDADDEAGAKIVDGTEAEEVASHNSWEVVAEDQIAHDEALARAAQMIGSALFNSDLERSNENFSTLSPASLSDSRASSVTSVPTTLPSLTADTPVSAIQLERWAQQLHQLHELGFLNDALSVDTIERLNAANIGVDSTEEVTVQQTINELMKGW